MKTKAITKEKIIKASISLVAKHGLENFTTKKAATSLGISEGTIFYYYANKKALLADCLYYIDSHIDVVLREVKLHPTTLAISIHDMWNAYYRYLAAHPEEAKFYLQFRHSSYYTGEVLQGQILSFSFFSDFLMTHMSHFHVNPGIFWVYIIETTLNFAIRSAEGSLDSTQEEIDNMYLLISSGINGVYTEE